MMVIKMVATLAHPHGTPLRGHFPPTPNDITCPECGANQPVTTPEGFKVCSACGCEYPDSQPYTCSDPLGHDKSVVQSHMIARKGLTTMIGTRAERAKCAKIAPNLEWAEKFGQTYEQEVFQRAYFEIRKIFAVFDLEDRATLFDTAMQAFIKAYRAIPKGTRNRNVHLLSLVATYRTLRVSKVPILLKTYLTSCLDKTQSTAREFLTALKDTAHIFPRADRGAMVRVEVSSLISRLAIPKSIQDAIGTILKHHASAFCSPKTAVRSAAIVCAAALATNSRAQFPLSAVSRSAGIATSAVIRCIIDACARYHCAIPGSLVYAGDVMRSLFLAPRRQAEPAVVKVALLKSRVREVATKAKVPDHVKTAATYIASNHGGAFQQRSPNGSAGAIIGTATLAMHSRKKYPLAQIIRLSGTNYSTLAQYIKVACQRVGQPLTTKLARAGPQLRSLFLDSPPGTGEASCEGPPWVVQEGPPILPTKGGPPPLNSRPAPLAMAKTAT